MANEVQVLYPVLVKPRRWSPYRRGWAWNPVLEKHEPVWVTNYREAYIRRNGGGSIDVRLGPEDGFKKNLTAGERGYVIGWARKRGWVYKLGERVEQRQYPFLAGDVDMRPEVCTALNAVGEALGEVIWIASGCRTFAEQKALYDRNMIRPGVPKPGRPLTAVPGTSNHEGCNAADAHVNGRPIGHSRTARELMRRNGLCLPVPGEPWHVERGTTWRA